MNKNVYYTNLAVVPAFLLALILTPAVSFAQVQSPTPNGPIGGGMPPGQGSFDPSAGGALPAQQQEPPVQGNTPWYEQMGPTVPMAAPGQMGMPGQSGPPPMGPPGQFGPPGQIGTPGQAGPTRHW